MCFLCFPFKLLKKKHEHIYTSSLSPRKEGILMYPGSWMFLVEVLHLVICLRSRKWSPTNMALFLSWPRSTTLAVELGFGADAKDLDSWHVECPICLLLLLFSVCERKHEDNISIWRFFVHLQTGNNGKMLNASVQKSSWTLTLHVLGAPRTRP